MALPGGVQHPATPERQTPPDSTPTQAVQKSRRETRREIRRLQREADRPPTAETRTEEEQDSLFDTKIDSIFGAPPLSPIAPADSTAPTGNDSLLRDSLRQDTTRRDTTRKNLSWTTSSAAKPGLALLRRTQPHGLYLQPGRYQLPEHESQGRFHAGQYGRKDHLRPRQARHDRRQTDSYQPHFHRRSRQSLHDGHDHLQHRQ